MWPLWRAQRLSMPISRVRCCTDTSMMFIRPMPPMPRVRAPINASRILSAVVTTVNSSKSCLKSAMNTARRSSGREVVVSGEHGAHHASQLLVVLALIVHKDSGDVFGVIEVAMVLKGMATRVLSLSSPPCTLR